MKNTMNKLHQTTYNVTPDTVLFVPGRVNLIGEHTDYSGGFVMPIAIDLGIYAAISAREDSRIEVYSDAYKALGIQTVHKPYVYDPKKHFLNYIEGMCSVLEENGHILNKGLSITLYSTLPSGAGLSSSAALEILIGIILRQYNQLLIDDLTLVYHAQAVENDYLNLASGILDQYAIMFGKAAHAMMLHTRLMTPTYIPINLTEYTLVLMNTNKTRKLTESAYNDRFSSIKHGEKYFNVPLDCVTYDMLLEKKHTINNDIIFKRLAHVIKENKRVNDAQNALINKDYKTLGQLMLASHESLKTLYEVSCEELDFLVEASSEHGALGARMTGAGFGGTMIALYEGELPCFEVLKTAYKKRFNYTLEIMITRAVSGPHIKEAL